MQNTEGVQTHSTSPLSSSDNMSLLVNPHQFWNVVADTCLNREYTNSETRFFRSRYKNESDQIFLYIGRKIHENFCFGKHFFLLLMIDSKVFVSSSNGFLKLVQKLNELPATWMSFSVSLSPFSFCRKLKKRSL